MDTTRRIRSGTARVARNALIVGVNLHIATTDPRTWPLAAGVSAVLLLATRRRVAR